MNTQYAPARVVRRRNQGPALVAAVPPPVLHPIAEAGAMAQLGCAVIWSAVRRPVGYWRAVLDEVYWVLKLCWFPLVLAVSSFGMMVAILGLNFTTLLGANNRYGQYFFIVNIREFSPWINSMVVAGIVGAALTADLGARKVREELDALEILGVDSLRELVLPRVLAAIVMTCLFGVVSILIGIVTGLTGSVLIGKVPAGEYLATLFANLTTVELWTSLLKSALFGLIIGVVCSYKGISCSGGSTGVGRAVNQAVVISFALIFIVDFFFVSIMLGLAPELQTVR
ncbi:ABC transporter permease [Pseudonocardia eucalypti]|uniref:ABC transporter permease n=1 Tax=Pseudonocardia eucalypti TaxID=648755 RepID=A0ABP9PTI2_9PSEU|nr:phospholipid/cholesterol/gamma-HCH transport system permease protein [Pseudonocardia eucalypti]